MNRIVEIDDLWILVYEDLYNKRIRVDEYEGKPEELIIWIEQNYPDWAEKIIVKAQLTDVPFFLSKGYEKEAGIPGYFNGQEMHFVTKYIVFDRSHPSDLVLSQNILENVLLTKASKPLPSAFEIKIASPEESENLAKLYHEVFPLYPTPIHDPDFILKSMSSGTIYVYISENGKIQSAASAEINHKYRNAELTDCATQKSTRGKGHMQQLILKLEYLLAEMKIYCLYTIARSNSYGINKVFCNLGYSFGGMLINNCYIYSGLEDMNVWCKFKQEDATRSVNALSNA